MSVTCHRHCRKMCECALDHNTRPELRPVQLQYYEALKELIEDSGRYDQKEDFTVVLQPFMRDMALPLDVRMLVTRDRFLGLMYLVLRSRISLHRCNLARCISVPLRATCSELGFQLYWRNRSVHIIITIMIITLHI